MSTIKATDFKSLDKLRVKDEYWARLHKHPDQKNEMQFKAIMSWPHPLVGGTQDRYIWSMNLGIPLIDLADAYMIQVEHECHGEKATLWLPNICFEIV